jgi:hypothetical protein
MTHVLLLKMPSALVLPSLQKAIRLAYVCICGNIYRQELASDALKWAAEGIDRLPALRKLRVTFNALVDPNYVSWMARLFDSLSDYRKTSFFDKLRVHHVAKAIAASVKGEFYSR